MRTARKMAVIVILSVFLVGAVLFLALPTITSFISSEENGSNNAKIATFAVCEQIGNYTYCKDKVFASCNKTLIEINDSYFYCNGVRHEVGNITLGETYLKNFTEKRQKGFITAWAIAD
jgi:hypothetical protein